jgi:hypothetical protein
VVDGEQRDAGVVLVDVARHRVQALDGQVLVGLAELAGVELEAQRFGGGQSWHRAQRLIDGPADLQLLRSGVVGIQHRAAALLGVGQVQAGGAGEATQVGVSAHELLVPAVQLRLPQLHVPVDPAPLQRRHLGLVGVPGRRQLDRVIAVHVHRPAGERRPRPQLQRLGRPGHFSRSRIQRLFGVEVAHAQPLQQIVDRPLPGQQ